jgi:hypothetical protein
LTLGTATGTGTILNDDSAVVTLPTVMVTTTQGTAVESPSESAVYTISRTGSTAGTLVVNFAWTGTAARTRYSVAVTNGTLDSTGTILTINAGAATATIVLTPKADGVPEPAQTAVLALTSSSAYTLGSPSSASATLYDTTAPTVSISPASASIAGSNKKNQTLTFTVSISGSSPNAVTVRVGTADGTAKAGSDYTAVSTTLTFAAGSVTSQTVAVTILSHKTGTLNKTFTLALSSPANATIAAGKGSSTITITGTAAQLSATIMPAGLASRLTVRQLASVVAAAKRQWQALGASRKRLARVRVVITTLPAGELGYTVGHTVYIDATAAGSGWNTSLALPIAGQMDLLTVVLHELGHVLGLPDGCHCGALSGLMRMKLRAGVRRQLPAHARVPFAATRRGSTSG